MRIPATAVLYATRSEFLRDLLREKKERMEAAQLRHGIAEGYRGWSSSRENLRKAMNEGKRREANG